MPKPLTTPEAYEARAEESQRKAEESFDRCDTDGFLSQAAHQLGAREDQRNAEILRNGGVARFVGLYEVATGRRVKAKHITTHNTYSHQDETSWLLHKDEAALTEARGKRYLPTGSKSRVLAKLGLAERWEWAPARARIKSWSHVGVERTGCEWGTDAELELGQYPQAER